MKLNFSFSLVIAFVSLIFFIQELHDWSHLLTSDWLCGCMGAKGFDSWSVCDQCNLSGNIMGLVWLAGPALTYALVWAAWKLMGRRNSEETRSVGFILFFATNPFVNILAALRGGGDLSQSLKMMFPFPEGSMRHFVSVLSLLLILAMTLPPLIRAYGLVRKYKKSWILIPMLILLPNGIKYAVVDLGMNFLLKKEIFQEEIMGGTALLVVIWLFLTAALIMVNFKSLSIFISRKDKKTGLSI